MTKKYCRVVETDVDIENGKCQKQIGSPFARVTCPHKGSLICPETELIREVESI